jgi:hypothetical protein
MTTPHRRWRRRVGGAAAAALALSLVPALAAPTRAAACTVRGGIAHYWSSVGGASSWLGACRNDEHAVPGAIRQDFDGGSVYWTPTTGPTSVRGEIRRLYDRSGATTSRLGVPTTVERDTPRRSGAFNHFQHGSIYWSPATGAQMVLGSIRSTWAALGWENGSLGFPRTGETPTTSKPGAFNHFEGGSVFWSPTTGAHGVWGAIRDRWAAMGWENSPLGFPTTSEGRTPHRAGAFTHFQHGSVYWSPTTGAQPVWGAFRAHWAGMGWENSALGFPAGGEYAVTGGARQDFQHGHLTWDRGTGAVTAHVRAVPAPRYGPGDQVRAAFYYGWYPSSFAVPGTRFDPAAGRYSTEDLGQVQRQIAQMRYAGIQAGIASWWGPETVPDQYKDYAASVTDRSLRVGLKAAEGTPFTWGVYYEDEAAANPSAAQIRADLDYVKARYAAHPNFLYRNGKPVVFVWPGSGDTCEMVHRWKQAAPDFYVVHKRFTGWESCRTVPDWWHQYAPAQRDANLTGYSYSVSPGFWQYNEGAPRLVRDAGAFDAAVGRMRASGAPWQLVTTFNEWGEGTAVEPASQWQSPSGRGWALDILRKHYGGF